MSVVDSVLNELDYRLGELRGVDLVDVLFADPRKELQEWRK
jgi:hypothetical protein